MGICAQLARSAGGRDRSQAHLAKLQGRVRSDLEGQAILERRERVVSNRGELRDDAKQPATVGDVAAGAGESPGRGAIAATE
jgi:hypothetical protein